MTAENKSIVIYRMFIKLLITRTLFGVDSKHEHERAQGVIGIADVDDVMIRPMEQLL